MHGGGTAKIEAASVINEENPHPGRKRDETNCHPNRVFSPNDAGTDAIIQRTAASTEKSAAEVKDIAPVIEELKTTTADVQTNATTILTNLDQSIQSSKQITKENEE